MTSDELAMQMGYGDVTQSEGHIPPTQPYEAPTSVSGAPAFTEEDIIASVVPGYSPSEPAAPPVPASMPVTTKSADKVSASTKGFNPSQYKKVGRATGDERSRAFAAVDAQGAQAGSTIGGMMDQAADLEGQAAQVTADVEHDLYVEEAAWRQKVADKRNEYALQEQESAAKAAGLAAEARTRYLASLEDYRAQKVNPNEMFQSLNKFDQAGTLAAVFVHDLLGAKGIKTSAMDTLNRSIDRNIDAQINNIKQKGEYAEGMKSLWEMQRAESASDAEARARVKTFMLQAMEDEVAAHVGMVRAGLADAKGMAAIAKIQSEKVKSQFEVFKYIDQSTQAKKAQEQQWIATKMQHSIQQAQLSIAAAREKREAAEAAAKANSAKMDGLIPDISDKGQGRMTWKYRDGVSKEAKAEVEAKILGTNKMSRNVNEYKDLVRQSEEITDLTAKTRFKNTNAARMRSLQVAILNDEILRTTGKAATKEEASRIEEMVPLSTQWTGHNVGSVVSGFEKRGYADLKDTIKLYAHDLPANDPRRQLQGAQYNAYEEQELKAKNEDKNEGKDPILPSDTAAKGLTRKDATKDAAESTIAAAIQRGALPQNDWENFTKAPRGNATPIPAYAVHLSELGALAKKGDPAALKHLEAWAGVGTSEYVDSKGKKIPINNNEALKLPNGEDAHSFSGQAMRAFATYELAKAAGVVDEVPVEPSRPDPNVFNQTYAPQ